MDVRKIAYAIETAWSQTVVSDTLTIIDALIVGDYKMDQEVL